MIENQFLWGELTLMFNAARAKIVIHNKVRAIDTHWVNFLKWLLWKWFDSEKKGILFFSSFEQNGFEIFGSNQRFKLHLSSITKK